MALTAALISTLAIASAAAGDRLLLCRPQIAGDPALARGEAVAEAGRSMSGRFLDYGVACEDASEGARAAKRAGLAYAVTSSAQGRSEGTRYELALADADTEAVRARRVVDVAPGVEAVRPLRSALDQLVETLPPPPGPRAAHVAAWSVAAAGVAAVVAGTVFALQARDAADRAAAASDLSGWVRAKRDWDRYRTLSGASLAAGGAAIAAGVAWRFAF
jgi:hypothetical protein